MNWKDEFCWYFAFFIVLSFFSRSQIFYISPLLFPRHIILKSASAVFAKHRQVVENTEKSLYDVFFGNMTQKESMENLNTLSFAKKFSKPENSRNTEEFPLIHFCYCGIKKTLKEICESTVTNSFFDTKKFQNHQQGHLTKFFSETKKISTYLFVTLLSMVHQIFCNS